MNVLAASAEVMNDDGTHITLLAYHKMEMNEKASTLSIA